MTKNGRRQAPQSGKFPCFAFLQRVALLTIQNRLNVDPTMPTGQRPNSNRRNFSRNG